MTARPFPPLKLAGHGSRFIPCPVCGEMLDKEDLAQLLEHEERHGGQEKAPATGPGRGGDGG